MVLAQISVLSYAEEALLVLLAGAALPLALRWFGVPQDLLQHGVGAAVGSVFVAYGLREFLRATGGGYYCCNHLFYQTLGVVMAALGWMILLASLAGPVRRQVEGGASADSDPTDG